MGGNHNRKLRTVVLLGGLVVLWGSVALGGAFYAEGFRTTGSGYEDWYWLSAQTHAQWEFLTLPASSDPYVALEAFLCLRAPNGTAPGEIEVRFQFATAGGHTRRTHVARLTRIQANHESALYFGQVFLSRRELGIGSRLSVRLDGAQSRLSIGVHPSSVRVSGGPGGGPGLVAFTENGRGGGPDEVSAILGGAGSLVGVPSTVRSLPDSGSAEAPFLAPGVYRGELGGPGAYHTVDMKDVYRVNLRVGQIVTVRVEATSQCVLILLDPLGRKVGEIGGSASLGLEHRATVTGVWQILVLCWVGSPPLTYTMTLHIR
jgi:hypothetical protein